MANPNSQNTIVPTPALENLSSDKEALFNRGDESGIIGDQDITNEANDASQALSSKLA